MSLRFIFGRSGSGKSYHCLEDIKSKLEKADNSKLILLVPEQFSFQAEKNLVNTLGEKGIIKAQVLSFTRMAYVVFNEVGGITHQHVNSPGKNILLYRAIESVKNDLKVFQRAGRQQGFVNVVSDIISEFKRYDVNPDTLRDVYENITDNEGLKDKLQDINLIFSSFERELHKKYIDTEDELVMLAEKLDKCHIFDDAEIWIDEFSSFTPLQYNIIEKLLKKAKRINITLNTDCLVEGRESESTDVFMPIKNTEGKLLKIIEENNVPYEEPICIDSEVLPRFRHSKELSHLEKYFFKFPYNVYQDETKDISIFKALNMYGEIQDTARDIIRLSRDEGIRFRDMAVLTRDMSSYEKLIQVIFSEYNIPYFIDQRRQINGNPLIILINSVLDIFTKNWSYESVFRYLKTGLTNIEIEEIDLLENYVLANGIRGNKWNNEKPWDYSFSYDFNRDKSPEDEKEKLIKINEIRDRVKRPLIDFYLEIKNSKNIKDTCSAIFNLLTNLNVYDKIEKWVEDFRKSGDLDLANEYSQIWNIVNELLDQIVEVIGEEDLKLEEFIKVLNTAINEYDIGVIPPSLDQVLVGSIDRARTHEVSALYLIGVNDGVFPQASNEEGMLNDKDREELRRFGVELALDTKSNAFEEQFLIYTSLTLSSKYLRISYPIANFEGKAMRPSIIISKLKKIFPKIKEDSDIIYTGNDEESLRKISGPDSTFNELVEAFREEKDGKKTNPIWWDVYRWYSTRDEWQDKCERAFGGLSYTNKVEFVSREKIRKLYGTPLQFSVSRLERYASCPFAYYVEYGLGAKDRKVYEFSSPDLGSFIHEILDDFSNVLEKEKMTWRDIDDEWCGEAISYLVDKKINEKNGYILSSSPRYEYMANRLKRIMTKSVTLISEHMKRSGFDPVGYEMSFGKNGDFPPISIELPSGEKIELIGRIDRVDEVEIDGKTYLRVIDYKSGNKSFKLSDVYYGLQLQLLVYLDAILSNADKYIDKGMIPGAILYFKIDDPIINVKRDTSQEDIEKEVMRVLKMKGLILKDAKVVKEMDRSIEGYSLIIPVQILKDGEISSRSSTATLEQFEILRKYVRKILIDLCEDMLKGNISIMPYKKKNATPCEYCQFSSICQFDTSMKDNKYKLLNDKNDEEVWELMKKEVEEEDGEISGGNEVD